MGWSVMMRGNSDPLDHVGARGGGGPRCIPRPFNAISNYNINHIWIPVMTAAFDLLGSVEMNSTDDEFSGDGREGGGTVPDCNSERIN